MCIRDRRNPDHPYRQQINFDFGARVEVYDGLQALNGQGLTPSSVQENLSIFVLTYDALRIKKKEGRKVYQENGNLAQFVPYYAEDVYKRQNLLYAGTYLFAGAPKIGKSFFMAQLSYHIATGTPLWAYPVHPGEVLYLALEDDYARIQKRLFKMFGMDGTDALHFATQSRTLCGGLSDQLDLFMQEHPNTKLIIVDTLQKIRELGRDKYLSLIHI